MISQSKTISGRRNHSVKTLLFERAFVLYNLIVLERNHFFLVTVWSAEPFPGESFHRNYFHRNYFHRNRFTGTVSQEQPHPETSKNYPKYRINISKKTMSNPRYWPTNSSLYRTNITISTPQSIGLSDPPRYLDKSPKPSPQNSIPPTIKTGL